MNFSAKPFKNWFGFSRRERRATFVLLVIVVIVTGLRYIIPESTIRVSDITGTAYTDNENSGSYSDQAPARVVYTAYRNNSQGDSTKKARSAGTRSTTGSRGFQRPEKTVKQAVKSQITHTDLNRCDSAELVRLPGIGPVLSARIIKYRHYLGGFANTGQLKEVYGLSPETYELIKDRVFADPSEIKKISINNAEYKELSRVRYLEKYELTAILKYRELKGRINNVGDLVNNKLITAEKAKKVEPYLKFE